MQDEKKVQFKVVPLEISDYEDVKTLVGKEDKLTEASESTSELTGYKVEGYRRYIDMVDASMKYRGGFGLLAQPELKAGERMEPRPSSRGKIVAYMFGEQGWEDKPYDRAGGLYGSEGMDYIVSKTEGAPVWFLTGFVFNGVIPGVAMQEFLTYLESWRASYSICAILPPPLADSVKSVRKYARYNGDGAMTKKRDTSSRGEYLVYCECHGDILRNCGIISDFQNMSELEDSLVNSTYRSGIPSHRRQRAFMMGATSYSFVRARLLAIGEDREKAQENLCAKHGLVKEAVYSLSYVYGATVEQTVEYGMTFLLDLITRAGVAADIVDLDEYARYGLGEAYLRSMAAKTHTNLEYLKEELAKTAGTAEDIRRIVRYFQDNIHAGKPVKAETAESKASRAWRGQHTENEAPNNTVIEACERRGVSKYLAVEAWKINFNYYRYLGRLVWLEKQAKELGVSVQEWFKVMRINVETVLRALQYNIDTDAAKRKIRGASEDLGKGVTMYSLCTEAGVTSEQYIKFVCKGQAGLDAKTRLRCKSIEDKLPKYRPTVTTAAYNGTYAAARKEAREAARRAEKSEEPKNQAMKAVANDCDCGSPSLTPGIAELLDTVDSILETA